LEQPPAEPLEGDHAFMFTTALSLVVGSQTVVLGQQMLHVDAATVCSDPERTAHLTVTPGADRQWTRRLAPPAQ